MKLFQKQLHKNNSARQVLVTVRNIITGGRSSTPSWPLRFLAATACFALIGPTGCHKVDRSAATMIVHHQITPAPAQVGPAVIAMQLTDTAANRISQATITVEAEMSHPGMGPAFTTAKEIAPGNYQASVNFTMRGDWVVLLHIKLPKGTAIERRIDVRSVGSN